MQIIIQAGMKEGKTTVAAAIIRALRLHNIEVDVQDDLVDSEKKAIGDLMATEEVLNERLVTLGKRIKAGDQAVTLITEQTPRA
jgi:hypothetical protein